MGDYDSIMKGSDPKAKSVYDRLSKQFSDETLDIREVAKHSNDPMFISLLLFKLVEERQKTNKILDEINTKLEQSFTDKEKKKFKPPEVEKAELDILPETDQRILDYIEQHGMADARQIMEALEYKGKNAASQRLSKLQREGHLRKVRSGRKVLYLARN